MVADGLPEQLALLGRLPDASPQRVLRQAVDLAVVAAPACRAASGVLWRAGDEAPDVCVASHPEAGDLLDQQLAAGAGPVFAARAGTCPVEVPDLADDPRWPRWAAGAVRLGLRAAWTLTRVLDGGDEVIITLYALRPGVLGTADHAAAALVLAQAGTALENSTLYDQVQRTAYQAQEALQVRSVIDQAKGVLMHARGIDADRAFAELRRISQESNVRVADVAAWMIARPTRTDGQPGH